MMRTSLGFQSISHHSSATIPSAFRARSTRGFLGLAALVGAMISGCSAAPTESTSPSVAVETSLRPMAESTSLQGSAVPDELAQKLVGTRALHMTLHMLSDLPVVGKLKAENQTYAIAKITRDGQGLRIEERGCRVDFKAPAASLNIPDKVPQTVEPTSVPLRVWTDGTTIQFVREMGATIAGAKLVDPLNDAMPTTDTDARVVDQDGDGHPGVTAKVSVAFINADVFIVQRLLGTYTGTLQANNDLVGIATGTSEQYVIGATNPLFKQKVTATLDPDTSKNQVRMVPVAEGFTCDQLIAQRSALFP